MAVFRCLHCKKQIGIDLTNGGWIHVRADAECLDRKGNSLGTKAEVNPAQFAPKRQLTNQRQPR